MIPSHEEYVLMSPEDRKSVRQKQISLGQEPYHSRKGIPSSNRGQVRLQMRGPRGIKPHTWRSGPDPIRHKLYYQWSKHKSQAEFRGEEHQLTYYDYIDIWANHWNQRGRQAHSMIMTRIDLEKGWTKDNTVLMERLQHIRRVREMSKLKS